MFYDDPYEGINKNLHLQDLKQYTEETRKEIADRISELMDEANCSNIDLANLLGISDRTVSRILKAETDCATPCLYEIAQIFNVSMDYLCYGKPSLPSSGELAELLSDRTPAEIALATRVLRALFIDDNNGTDRR